MGVVVTVIVIALFGLFVLSQFSVLFSRKYPRTPPGKRPGNDASRHENDES